MNRRDALLYQRAKDFLMRRTNYENFKSIPYDRMSRSLDRLERFLEFLGSPDQRYAIIHVAGTKGKGTTCAALDQIYRAAGYRTGLFTSPHLDEIVERFQIDGRPCDKAAFAKTTCALAERWRAFVASESTTRASRDESEPRLTFFEWTLVIATVLFAQAKVDVAILEVGMGGRFDATNACYADVSALTSVSYDHCEQLGNTLRAIATEKLGIVKSNAPLVCGVGFDAALYSGLEDYKTRRDRANAESLPFAARAKFGSDATDASRAPASPAPPPDVATPTLSPVAPLFQVGAGINVSDYAFAVDPQTIITADDARTIREMAREKAAAFGAPFVSVESLSPRVAALSSPPFDSVWRWNFEIATRVAKVLATRETAPQRRPGAGDPEKTRRFPVSDAAIAVAAKHFSVPCRAELVRRSPRIVVDGAHNRASVAAFLLEARERFPGKKIYALFAPTLGKDIRGMLAELAARADEIYLSERKDDVRALPLPELIRVAETLMDETCPEDSPIRGKFHVAPDFKAFLGDYCARPNRDYVVLCALGSFYFAAKVRKLLKKDV